jgi:hypothetical protein
MTTSKHITGLIGPTTVALAISEAMNLHIWDQYCSGHVSQWHFVVCRRPLDRPRSQSLDPRLARAGHSRRLACRSWWPVPNVCSRSQAGRSNSRHVRRIGGYAGGWNLLDLQGLQWRRQP